jgi:hypothetical protein
MTRRMKSHQETTRDGFMDDRRIPSLQHSLAFMQLLGLLENGRRETIGKTRFLVISDNQTSDLARQLRALAGAEIYQDKVTASADLSPAVKEILQISGFCKGLSIRDGIDLDEDERKMLLRAGELLQAICTPQVWQR